MNKACAPASRGAQATQQTKGARYEQRTNSDR